MAKFVLTAQLQLQAPKNVASVVNQIQNQLRGVKVNVEAQGTAQAQREIKKLTTTTDQASKSAGKMGKAFDASLRRFAGLAIATRAVSLFTNTLGGAVREAISFERELIKISQVTGKTMSDLRFLTDTITNLSTKFGVASSSLLNVSRILSQAGFNAKETDIALTTLAKTELAPTFDNITQTAEGAVAVFNQFRKGAEALEEQLGAINAVAGKFAVEAGDLISVLRRAGGVFQASGGQLNELIALFTSVRSTTRESADSIATGLRTIFTRIQRPRTIEYLQQFGVELIDLEGKFIGPFEATKRLSQALAGLEQGDITFIKIAEELGGFRQIGKVIPLLQQFQVAQEAFNVAQAGGNSLSSDAAKAQQTLAVRLDQVQEKFTALIRSISETVAFQSMATTAIALAEAIVKVGEAIKPVLPLLSGLAAFKLIKGFGGFAGNVGKNLQGFNSGGLVPGTGNRDTVPAMLTPGEFVIKKDSVSKLGASSLASANKYAAGGIVTPDRTMYGTNPPIGMSPASLAKQKASREANAAVRRRKQGEDAAGEGINLIKQGELNVPFGVSFASQKPATLNSTIKGVRNAASSKAKSEIDRLLMAQFQEKNPDANVRTVKEMLQYVPNGSPLIVNGAKSYSLQDGKGAGLYEDILENGLPDLFKQASSKFNGTQLKTTAKPSIQELVGNSALGAIQGSFFEAFVRSVTNSPLSKKEQKDNSIFDFTSLKPKELTDLFGTNSLQFPNEFKNQANRDNISSAVSKAFTLANKQVKFFNTGGPVGTDTVPALLTPGEFVVNKKSAQNIGYDSLSRMNKVGKYAAGGVVRDGRNNYGIMPAGGEKLSNTKFSKEDVATRKLRIETSKAAKSMAKFGAGAFVVTTALNQMLPAVKENEGAAIRFARSMTDSVTQVIGSIGTLGFALQGLGKKFDIATLMQNKYVSGITAAAGAAALVSAGLEALYDSTNRYNQAVKEGNVAEAQRLATGSSTAGARKTATIGAGAGAAGIAAFFGLANPIGALTVGVVAAGAAFGLLNAGADTFQDFLSLFGAQTASQVKAQTAAKIATQNFTVELQKATERATRAFEEAQRTGDFAGGGERNFAVSVDSLNKKILAASKTIPTAISAVSKELERSWPMFMATLIGAPTQILGEATGFVQKGQQTVGGEIPAYETEQSRNIVDNFFKRQTNLIGSTNQVVERLASRLESATGRSFNSSGFKSKIAPSVETFLSNQKSSAEEIKAQQSFINQAFRSSAISGQFEPSQDIGVLIDAFNSSIDQINNDDFSQESKDLFQKEADIFARQIRKQLNPVVDSLVKSGQLSPSIGQTIKSAPAQEAASVLRSLQNIGSEIEKLQKRFELINLGLSPFNANVTASNVALKNYLSSVDGSSTELQRSFNTLTAALSASGSAISDADFDSSLEGVTKTLNKFGATPDSVSQTQEKLKAGRTTQNILADYISSLGDGTNFEKLKSTATTVGAQGEIADILAERLKVTDVDEVIAKQIVQSFRDNKPSEALAKTFNSGDISGFQNALGQISSQFINQLAPSIKKIIESEKLLDGALKKRIEAENQLYTAQTKAISIELEAAAIQSQYGGEFLSTADKLKNLTKSMNVSAGGAGVDPVQASVAGLSRRMEDISLEFDKVSRSSTEGAAQQKRLQNLAEQTITQTRQLIKIRQEEYDSIKRKNALEKETLDSLISGDIDSFFKGQASEGALGAVAAGRGDLAQQFGGEALSGAVEFLNKLRSSGETEFQGQKISGPGGLEERTRIAALTARGVTDSGSALRSAQIGADTTPELNVAATGIREGAEVLKQAGELQMQLAQNQVIEAQNVYVNAKNELLNNIKPAADNRKFDIKTRQPITDTPTNIISEASRKIEQRLQSQIKPPQEQRYDFRFDSKDLSSVDDSMKMFRDTVNKFVGFTPTLKLDTTNLVVTLNANQLLEKMPQFIFEHAKPLIQEAIENASVGPNGKLHLGTGSTLSTG